ncbi:MAG: hypothetical protein JWP41_3935, partial [Ramlibacter sp.]|nr:hypothetical protein [Ramlibacter sp.]
PPIWMYDSPVLPSPMARLIISQTAAS